MARFELELPLEVIEDIARIEKNADKIFGEMTRAGAEVAYENVKRNVPSSWHNSKIMHCVKITKTYKTPSDDGIATKIIISGYFKNRNGVKTPAPLVANVTEYGSVKQPKRPFFRKSFKKAEIEKAMLKAQEELSGGMLSE
jgi:hypothetical protein